MKGEVYSIPKWTGLKTKDVKVKLGGRETIPSLEEAKANIANSLAPTVDRLAQEQKAKLETLARDAKAKADALNEKNAKQRALQKQLQMQRAAKEMQDREDRFNKGARGLLDRLTGQHSRTRRRNEGEAFQASLRDQKQRDELILRRLQKQRELAERHKQDRAKPEAIRDQLRADLDRLEALRSRYRTPKPDGHDRER